MAQLVILIIFGVVCMFIAQAKGRSMVGWFFVGFLTGLIGLIIILCMSDLKAEEQKEAHMLNEQRRLREQLRQERMRNRSFQEYANNRMDAHDESLQLDTRSADARLSLEGDAKPATDDDPASRS